MIPQMEPVVGKLDSPGARRIVLEAVALTVAVGHRAIFHRWGKLHSESDESQLRHSPIIVPYGCHT